MAKQWRLKRRVVVTLLCCVAIYGIASLWDYVVYFPFTPPSVEQISAEADWPKPLKSLHNRAVSVGVEWPKVDVCIVQDVLDSYYYFRIPTNNNLFELMADQFELSETTKEIDFASAMLPAWWDTATTKEGTFYVGMQSNVGDKGDKFTVMHDSERNLAFVMYHENW